MSGEFDVHRLNAVGLQRCDVIAEDFDTLLADIEKHVPAGRERALVVTKLQEACFWAKRAIAVREENQAREHRFTLDEDTTYCLDCGQTKHSAAAECPGKSKP